MAVGALHGKASDTNLTAAVLPEVKMTEYSSGVVLKCCRILSGRPYRHVTVNCCIVNPVKRNANIVKVSRSQSYLYLTRSTVSWVNLLLGLWLWGFPVW